MQTYAEPVAGPPPSGSVRIVPKTPVLTPTKAVYEWQIVCDRSFHSFSGVNSTTTISGGTGYSRLKGELPTVLTYFVEVETTPHGDGSMAIKVSQGHRDAKTRPLLSPSATPSGGGYGMGSSGSDGYRQAPAASFVHPLLTAQTDLPLPATADLARIDLPAPAYGDVTAVKYGPGMAHKEAYHKRVPLGPKGALPPGAMSNPTLAALAKQGYQVSGSFSADAPTHDTARLIVRP